MSDRFSTTATSELLNAMPDAVIVCSEEGVICAANDRAAGLFRCAVEDLIGRSRSDLTVPAHRGDPLEQDRAELTFASLVTLAGEPFSAWIRSSPMQNGELQATSIRSFPQSGSVTIDPEMSILETLSEGVLIVDRDGRITYINMAGRSMIGLDEGAPFQSTVQALFSTSASDSHSLSKDRHIIEQVLSDGAPLFRVEALLQTVTDTEIDVSLNATALVSAG